MRNLLAFVLLAIGSSAAAQSAPSGYKAEYLAEWDHAAKQVVALAEAVPAEKYSWRPAKEVRSWSEVQMHITAGNHLLLDRTGVQPPADLYKLPGTGDRTKEMFAANSRLEKTVTEKGEVLKLLKESLAAVRAAFETAGLEKPADFFGTKTTVRGIYTRLLVHLNEHMGQSIAYARSNGIAPPWSP